ncbi:MAG TPA: cob(I)yrinic acid a,c-diamide adenosyltransferase [Candidatus Acidoferrum sp.]|nr:cob(I)yrinic acid a,c-diamide adenosyltransferase [Candidatus Acidoferrum sp.]
MSFYTGRGDKGETDTMGFGRMTKDSPLAVLLGDIDELNSAIGVAILHIKDETILSAMNTMQDKLFTAGADAASINSNANAKRISESDVKWASEETDKIGKMIPELKKFVLPGGSPAGAHLHFARSVARRAERSAVALSHEQETNSHLIAFLNRTSSLLFVAALYMNKKAGVEESHPTY